MHKKIATVAATLLAGSQGIHAAGAYTGDTGQVFHGVQLSDLSSLYSGQYKYDNVGHDSEGNCKTAGSAGQTSSSSPIAPLDGEMHHVMRGPINLSQFAVYTLGSLAPASKRSFPREAPHQRRRRHQQYHDTQKRENGGKEKRALGDLVTATIDGQVATFTDNWDSPAGTAAPEAASVAATPAADSRAPAASTKVASNTQKTKGDVFLGRPQVASSSVPAVQASTGGSVEAATPSVATSPAPVRSSSSDSSDTASGAWSRIAYYDAESQTSEGLVFLANAWDGNILYASSDGVQSDAGKSKSPTLLSNVQVDQNNEFIIASDQKCNGDCGLTYPGSAESNFDAARPSELYHGWKGDRVILAEYSMPHVDASGLNGDMPGWWSLASSIVNNQQYGSCTPWTAGAGELDIHEVLKSDLSKGYVSTHMGKIYGGQGPAIDRPTSGTLKLALILNGTTAAIQALPLDTEFGSSINDEDILDWISHKTVGNSKIMASGNTDTTWTPTGSPSDIGSSA